jgi:uncharacterized protein
LGIRSFLSDFHRKTADGVIIELRVTPKSSRDQIDGVYVAADGSLSLKIKVRAQPEKGRANQAVIAIMSKFLEQPKSCLEMISGLADRRKSLLVRADAQLVIEKLKDLQGEAVNGCADY